MFEDIPVDVSPIYEGERIRKGQYYVELAGPKSKGAELARVLSMNDVNDEKVTIIGPDLDKMEEGKAYPFGLLVKIAGDELETDLEGVFERKIHYYLNYIQGFMHLNSRDLIWCRVSKDSYKKGLRLYHIGKVLIRMYKKEFSAVKKVEVVIYTDEKEVEKFIEEARRVYAKRDARLRGLKDEDADVFYSCLLCQSFAPSHVCVITPNRPGGCGAVTWLEGRAAVKIDPNGPIGVVEKGKCLDPIKGEYEGVNKYVQEKSGGKIQRVYLYSLFDYPHTSCGCFEAIAFYIPEVDGIGIVHREFKGATPIGLPFSTLAGQVGGGMQSNGFLGIAIEFMRSPKFLQADGGWYRVVWMPKALKERVKDAIPKELYDKIATEEEVKDLESLKKFLIEKEHPVMKKKKVEELKEEKIEEKKEEKPKETITPQVQVSQIQQPMQVMPSFTIVLKNAKIYAEKIIIKRK